MRTADFDFVLPPGLIAQVPAARRDQSRLLVLHRQTGQIEHRVFSDLVEFLKAGDVLVLNDSRVIRARLRGLNVRTGGAFEVLLLEENEINDWWAMLRPGKRGREGTEIIVCDRQGKPTSVSFRIIAQHEAGYRRLRFMGTGNILEQLEDFGEVPLPPYIRRSGNEDQGDEERYQTVFANRPGSVAAPTAGLHFTEKLLQKIRARGVETAFVTLHVGPGTFAPVKGEAITAHRIHEERFAIGPAAAGIINAAKLEGRRVIAVGTTSCRVLETVADKSRMVRAARGKTGIFIYPPYDYKVVDVLLTNFHLPRSTLLMLVSAFASPAGTGGREVILSAYAEAIGRGYRFFSYGDAMLLL